MDAIKSAFLSIVGWLVKVLPDSPIQAFIADAYWGSGGYRALTYLNWLVPFEWIRNVMAAWVAAMLAFIGWRAVKRLAIDRTGRAFGA